MTVDFWNNTEIEKTKPFWIENEEDTKLLEYLNKGTNLLKCFNDSVIFAQDHSRIHGDILDVGAGVAWTSAILSQLPRVKSIMATDISEHRLKKIAPIVFRQMKGDLSKFSPLVADFQNTNFGNKKFNVILFCQSLYMFPHLKKIVKKVADLMDQGAILMIVAEKIRKEKTLLNYQLSRFKWALSGRTDESNNHFYQEREYISAIKACGLKFCVQELSYPVFHNGSTNCVNYFGIKN